MNKYMVEATIRVGLLTAKRAVEVEAKSEVEACGIIESRIPFGLEKVEVLR